MPGIDDRDLLFVGGNPLPAPRTSAILPRQTVRTIMFASRIKMDFDRVPSRARTAAGIRHMTAPPNPGFSLCE
jgi:hypothetical protein